MKRRCHVVYGAMLGCLFASTMISEAKGSETMFKNPPFSQPIPVAFGGAQYVSDHDGVRIKRGHGVHGMQKGYTHHMKCFSNVGVLKIESSQIYTISYFLSIKMVVDTSQTFQEVMALKINGRETAPVTLSMVSSTVYVPNTTLVQAIFNASSSVTLFLQKGETVELVLSRQSTLPHWGDKRVRVFAASKDLAASLYIQSSATVP